MRLGVGSAVVDGTLVEGDVEVGDGVVRAVGLSPDGGLVAAPGFVDLQVNGFGGVDLRAADAAGYARAGATLLRTGVTAYQPTFITGSEVDTLAALREVPTAPTGPRILGVHLEGPFLSPRRLGTHPGEWRRDPDLALLERLVAAGPVRRVTLAPELPGALTLVRWLIERGIVVSAGHTDATAEQAHAGFAAGIRSVTHLFNAMRPFAPRDPGIVAVALVRDDLFVQLIVDGEHLAAETVSMVRRAAPRRIALVTDAMAAAGGGDGTYYLGDVTVEVVGGVARRGPRMLAGSTVTMDAAVRNFRAAGADLAEAVNAATLVPARTLGRRDVGRLTVGGPADVTILDEGLEVRRVLVAGQVAHEWG